MNQIKIDFYQKCERLGVNPLTDISNFTYVSNGTNINFECVNNHSFRGTVGKPGCPHCETILKIQKAKERMLEKENKQMVIEKLDQGMKIINYNVSDGCMQSFPCQHFVDISLEDGSSATLIMYNGANRLNDLKFHES